MLYMLSLLSLLSMLSLHPLLLSSVFVCSDICSDPCVSVPDNKGVPRAPISQGITLLDNSPEFPPKLDQTQRIPAYPISFCHSTQENFCHSAQENFSTMQLQRLLSARMFQAWTDFEKETNNKIAQI